MACGNVQVLSMRSRTQVYGTHHDHALLLTFMYLPHRIIDNFMAQVQHLRLMPSTHAGADLVVFARMP
jgi:hypothetical protein